MARGRERRHHALARTRRAFIPTLLTLLLVPASTAAAADYCVSNPACMAAGGTDAGNGSAAIQNALDAAEDTPEADRVLIGPGEFDAAGDGGYRYWASSAVEIAGAGAGKTILTLSAPQSDVFTLDFDALSRNGRLHDIGFLLGPGHGGNAVALAGVVAERIAVTSGPATDANQGIRFLSDAVLRDSTIDVRGKHPTGLLIGSLVGGDYLAERVTIHSDDEGVASGPQPGSKACSRRSASTRAARRCASSAPRSASRPPCSQGPSPSSCGPTSRTPRSSPITSRWPPAHRPASRCSARAATRPPRCCATRSSPARAGRSRGPATAARPASPPTTWRTSRSPPATRAAAASSSSRPRCRCPPRSPTPPSGSLPAPR